MIDVTLKAELVSFKDEYPYLVYVFKNLDFPEYIVCTRFPNWDMPPVMLGDKGYINYRIVIAGKDTWYNKEEAVHVPYNYNGNHFINFIPLKEYIKEIKVD